MRRFKEFQHWWIVIAVVLAVVATILVWRASPSTYEIDRTITDAPSDCQRDLRFAVMSISMRFVPAEDESGPED